MVEATRAWWGFRGARLPIVVALVGVVVVVYVVGSDVTSEVALDTMGRTTTCSVTSSQAVSTRFGHAQQTRCSLVESAEVTPSTTTLTTHDDRPPVAGTQLLVDYVPGSPGISRISGQHLFGTSTVVFVAVFALLAWYLVRLRRRALAT